MVDPLATLLLTWLGTYLLHSTLLLGAAWGVGRLLGARATALRTHLWRAALVGALVTATAQSTGLVTRLPQADLDLRALSNTLGRMIRIDEAAAPRANPAAARSADAQASRPTDDVGTANDRSPASDRATAHALPSNAASSAPASTWLDGLAEHWAALALGLWILGAAFGLLRLVVLAVLARRELADRIPASPALSAELEALAARHGVRCPRLTVSATLGGPVSLPNGEIVVPEWCLALAPRQRAALLAHELAHQRHADPQWLSAALVFHRLLWVQPLLGLARRELASLAELEADAWAARAVDDPRALAECLARCAEHLVADRVAAFGAAMADGAAGRSPLLERIDRLLEGMHMTVKQTPWTARVGVVLVLAAGVFLLPGLVTGERMAFASGTNIHIDDSGDRMRAEVDAKGYEARLETYRRFTLTADESELATLEAGGEFELAEEFDGVGHQLTVEADRDGKQTRVYKRSGKAVPFDAEAKRWLAAALPRLMRATGFDAEARVGRLLAKGGTAAVFAELDLIASDYVRATYLGALLGQAELAPAELDRLIAMAAKIGSDFEKRRALEAALGGQRMDAPRTTALLQAAATIGSDYERAELLIAATAKLDGDAGVRESWLRAASGIGSDFELKRTLEAGLERHHKDPLLTLGALRLAKTGFGSDFERRTLLEAASTRVGTDRASIDAYLAAAHEIGGDFERREALFALLVAGPGDAATLAGVLDAAAGMGSDFEQTQVLEKLAPKIGGDATLTKRYREIARGLGEFERGEALKALDDAQSL